MALVRGAWNARGSKVGAVFKIIIVVLVVVVVAAAAAVGVVVVVVGPTMWNHKSMHSKSASPCNPKEDEEEE